jgi:hypothetical protein
MEIAGICSNLKHECKGKLEINFEKNQLSKLQNFGGVLNISELSCFAIYDQYTFKLLEHCALVMATTPSPPSWGYLSC